jgi:hypothetical protein
MSALNNLIQFAERLDGELLSDFQQRINAYMDERDRLQNERIATSQATTGTFDVVAIAGTAETLLNEINVGDTVICVVEFALPYQSPYQNTGLDGMIPHGYTATVDGVYNECISFHKSEHLYKKSNFRKVSTPIVNPLNSVEGC